MQTHHDLSHNSPLRKLMQEAQRMSDAGENQLTAGFRGESSTGEETHHGILCRKMPDDPLRVTRISVGESLDVKPSAYCVFRGDKLTVLDLLRRAIKALERSDL